MGKRIGILTGGGDVPGLNTVLKGVVYRGTENNYEVIGLRRGWEGLTHVNLDDPESTQHYVLPLDRANTRTIDRFGGTILHTSRANPARMRQLPAFLSADTFPKSGATWDMSSQVLANLDRLGIEQLVVIGGDGTLSYAQRLDKLGVKVVAIPKTMDNDVRNTEYCVGFSTAITRATAAIQRQRTTVASHERIGIFRVFGRDSGFTSLYTAYTTSIRCAIPEYEVNLDKLIDLLLVEKRSTSSNYVLVVLSEGSRWQGYQPVEFGDADNYGHRHKASVGEALSHEIKRRTSEETIVSDLTYDLRSGEPDFVDKMIAATYGNIAMDAVLAGKSGVMAAIVDGRYALAPIPDPTLGPRKVDVATLYNTDRYRPTYSDKLGAPVFLMKVD
jgi:6-phosphofructokinase 1